MSKQTIDELAQGVQSTYDQVVETTEAVGKFIEDRFSEFGDAVDLLVQDIRHLAQSAAEELDDAVDAIKKAFDRLITLGREAGAEFLEALRKGVETVKDTLVNLGNAAFDRLIDLFNSLLEKL